MICFSGKSLRRPTLLGLLAAVIFLAAAQEARAVDAVIDVGLDRAKLVKLEEPAAEIIVGNPAIADVSVQNAKLIVVTGKSFGRTNLIVVNAEGKVITNSDLTVGDPGEGMVTVHRGAKKNYSVYCAPKCTAPLAIGDDTEYFSAIQGQISAKQGMAQGAASEGSGAR